MTLREAQDRWLKEVLNRTPEGKAVSEAAPAPPPPPPPPNDPPKDPPNDPPNDPTPKTPPQKPRATIAWAPPPPTDWAPGGVVLGPIQLTATTTPPNLALVYTPPAGTSLGVDTHDLTVALAPDSPCEADPVTVRFTVRKPRATITWAQPAELPWTQGGVTPGPTQLNATVAPPGPTITYTPATPYPLPIGAHPITASLAETEPAAADPVTITLTVTKAQATIDWAQPAELPWTEGGVTPGPTQLNATTTPPGIKLAYTPKTAYPLPIGQHEITAAIDESEPYAAAPKTITLTVRKGQATITWLQPAPMVWAPGGATPGPAQLNATTTPPGLPVTYPDLPQGALDPNPYPITATLDHPSYEAAPVRRTLVVEKAPHGLTWAGKLAAPFTPGGLLMGEKFRGAVKNPNKLNLAFNPPIGTRFPAVSQQPLSVTHDDPGHYDPTPLTGTLDIRPGKATITLNPPQRLRTGPDGTLAFDPTVLNATTTPPGLALDIYPIAGTILRPGRTDVAVGLDPAITDFEAVTAAATIQIDDGTVRNQPQPNQPNQPQPRPPVVIPQGEYPYGSNNTAPHIHRYGNDFHLQIHHRGRVHRYNIIQNATLHAQAADALDSSADNPRLHELVQAIIDQFGGV